MNKESYKKKKKELKKAQKDYENGYAGQGTRQMQKFRKKHAAEKKKLKGALKEIDVRHEIPKKDPYSVTLQPRSVKAIKELIGTYKDALRSVTRCPPSQREVYVNDEKVIKEDLKHRLDIMEDSLRTEDKTYPAPSDRLLVGLTGEEGVDTVKISKALYHFFKEHIDEVEEFPLRAYFDTYCSRMNLTNALSRDLLDNILKDSAEYLLNDLEYFLNRSGARVVIIPEVTTDTEIDYIRQHNGIIVKVYADKIPGPKGLLIQDLLRPLKFWKHWSERGLSSRKADFLMEYPVQFKRTVFYPAYAKTVPVVTRDLGNQLLGIYFPQLIEEYMTTDKSKEIFRRPSEERYNSFEEQEVVDRIKEERQLDNN